MTSHPSSKPMTPERAGLVLRLQEWSRNCLIDGLKMDKGEPILQALLREAVTMLSGDSSAPETTVTHEDRADLLSMAALVARKGRESLKADYKVEGKILLRAAEALHALAETRQTKDIVSKS